MAREKQSSASDLEAAAAEAKRKAEAAQATGRAVTNAQRQLRDAAIVSALHAGHALRDVASDFGITTRQVRNVAKHFRERRTMLEAAPMEIIERLLRTYESQIARFAAIAAAHLEDRPSIAVRALQGEVDATERYANLLGDIGKLPDNLELFRSEMEMRRVGEAMVEALQLMAAGEITAGDVLERFERLLQPAGMVLELGEGDVHEAGA